MLETFMQAIGNVLEIHPILAVLACFFWGVSSVILSPCQFATVSILSAPNIVDSKVNFKVPIFLLGHALALFIIGLAFVLFSIQMDFFGHYWTVPFGVLFIYMAYQLVKHTHCNHCAPENSMSGFVNKFTKFTAKTPLGFFSLGLAYGFLSSSCVLVFLLPVLFLGSGQSLSLLLCFSAAFALGHSMPIILAGVLAKSMHNLMCTTGEFVSWPRRVLAVLFVAVGLILVAHPFLELMGFDFHGHGHGHGHEHGHEHEHNHEDAHEHGHDH